MTADKPFLVRLPTDLHRAVKAAAIAQDRSMAQVVRAALRLYLASETSS